MKKIQIIMMLAVTVISISCKKEESQLPIPQHQIIVVDSVPMPNSIKGIRLTRISASIQSTTSAVNDIVRFSDTDVSIYVNKSDAKTFVYPAYYGTNQLSINSNNFSISLARYYNTWKYTLRCADQFNNTIEQWELIVTP